MNRQLIIDAILEVFRCAVAVGSPVKETILLETLKRIDSDSTLLALAIDLNIDTDKVLSRVQVRS